MWQQRRAVARVALAMVVLGGSALLGCGGGSKTVGGDPPGTQLRGTGPCADVNAAALRVVSQFLGLVRSRQEDLIVGTGDDPTDVVYRLQDGVTPKGTTIRPFFDATGYTLNADYFVFFVDPSVQANFQHRAFNVFVRPGDGTLFVQTVTAFPVVGGVTRLTGDADRRANLVYLHEDFEGIAFEPAGRQARLITNADGGGLWLGGSDEERRGDDLQNAADAMQELTGEANPISVLWHKHPDEIDKDDLAAKLRTASLGMGAGDKFFLFISTHGSAPPGSQIQVGNDFITYEELCRLINENVTAGHVNIFNGACFGGAMTPVFLECDQLTTKAFHWFSDTDAATSSWSCPDNLGTSLALQQLAAALSASGGNVTLAEVEAAMANLDVSDGDIIAELCKCLEGSPLHDEICLNFETTDGPDDDYPRPGDPQTGGFPQDPPAPQQLALEERRLPINFGGGTGTIGLDPVTTLNATGTLSSSPIGLPFMPSFFDVFTEFTLDGVPGTGTAQFDGPIIQISRQGAPFRELLDGGDDVITEPGLGSDPNDRVWALWRGDTGRVVCPFPPLAPSQVLAPLEPVLIRSEEGPFRLITQGLLINGQAGNDSLNFTSELLVLVTPRIIMPSGRQAEVRNGIALLTFRPGAPKTLSLLTLFSVDGQQNFMNWQINLPANSPTSGADVDRDGDADLLDLSLLQQAIHFPETPPERADLNSDGQVNLQDIVIFQQHFTGP